MSGIKNLDSMEKEQIVPEGFDSIKDFNIFVDNYKFEQFNRSRVEVCSQDALRAQYSASRVLNTLSVVGDEIEKEKPTKLPPWVKRYRPPKPIKDGSVFLLSRSQLAESLLMLNGEKFRFNRHNERGKWEDRRYLYPIYNTKYPRVFLMCGRQVEKTQTLANIIVTSSIATPFYKSIYLSPSILQTSTFSSEKLSPLINRSPLIKEYFIDSDCRSQMFDRSLSNGSYIFLRSAYRNADRARGIPAFLLAGDEIQDQLKDNLDVVSECLAHAAYPMWIYSCTPKSLDNTANGYWEKSTKGEWFVPCLAHGTPKNRHSWYWQILNIDNIGKYGLVCGKCGKPIFSQLGEWRWTGDPNSLWRGFRISQLMVPWVPWRPTPDAPPSIIEKLELYDDSKFFNEVLGYPHDSAEKPMTMDVLSRTCDESLHNCEENLALASQRGIQLFGGGDWGTKTSKSYTVFVVGTFEDNKMKVIYAKRFEGREQDYSFIIPFLTRLITKYNIICGFDQGIGFAQNDLLAYDAHGAYGIPWDNRSIFPILYVGNQRDILVWNEKKDCYMLERTRSMNKLFQAIRRGEIVFPRLEDMRSPFFQDILNIHQEVRTSSSRGDVSERMFYSVHPELTDDFFHSLNFCRQTALAYFGYMHG